VRIRKRVGSDPVGNDKAMAEVVTFYYGSLFPISNMVPTFHNTGIRNTQQQHNSFLTTTAAL